MIILTSAQKLGIAVGQNNRDKSSTNYLNHLPLSVFTPLSSDELQLRTALEDRVRSAFYTAGMALIQLNELRLYRSTHLSFEEFCQDVFSFSRDYAYLKMAAAKIYHHLLERLPTNGRHLPLPTRQRQLRPMIKAKLNADAQLYVWSNAVTLAEGKVPPHSLVSEAVRLYLAENSEPNNPFSTGEICRLVVRGNSQLKGLGGSWCIVSAVHLSSCSVNTWNDELEVPIENLESLGFDPEQYQTMEDLGVRMTLLHETGKLDDAAMWVLNGLAKLNRHYLTPLEEKLLQLLEAEYGIN